MKRIIAFLLCVSLVTVCFSGCVIADLSGGWGSGSRTVRGEGALESFEIRVGGYGKIRIEGQCDVHYYASPSDTVTLTIQPNLREYFEVEVIGNELVIRSERGMNISTSRANTPVLTVSTPDLTHLNIRGMGNFIAFDKIIGDSFSITQTGMGDGTAELEVGELTLNMTGMGDFILSGKADKADFNVEGMGSLKASALQTRTAKIDFRGMGDASIYCTDNLSVNASGMGSLRYKGSPVIDSLKTSGMVKVLQED